MTNAYKILGQLIPAANTLSVLYTVPSGRSAVVSSINICNQSIGATQDIRVAVVPGGVSVNSYHYVAYGLPIPYSDSINLALGVTLAGNDAIQVYANNTTSISFAAFGLEVY